MKNKIFILLVIVFSLNAFAQNRYPAPFKLNYELGSTSGIAKVLDPNDFEQNTFFITTQWSGHTKMLDALKFNSVQGSTGFDNFQYQDPNLHKFEDIPNSNGNVSQIIIENKIANWSRVFQYEPTLALDPNQPDELVIRSGDTTHPVFGFTYRRGRVLTDSTDPNFNRLIIDGGN
jgi:hypothetical protein